MAYAERRAANPGALGLTIGLNLAAVAALAAWNPSFIKEVFTVIPLIDPKVDDPLPPPLPDDPQPHKRRQVDQVDAKVDTGRSHETTFPRDPDPGPIAGEIGPIPFTPLEPFDPPPPQTIRRAAAMATSPTDLQPPYPPALQRQEIEGSVTVKVLVGMDGRPRDIVLVRTDDPGFFAAAKSWGLRHWRFKPASENDAPVEGWFTLTVRFTIN